METSLLTTKVRIPPKPHQTVLRTSLITTLEDGIPHYKLICISAPAGYGKTTLLTQWAHSSEYAVCWFTISEDDNNLERFLRYLLRAWENVQPDIRETQLSILLDAMTPDTDRVLSEFINVASDLSGYIVFVLDDYHLIADTTIHDALTFLLDHLPATTHFVIAGRGEPQLPLARYRARNELRELHIDDLRFAPTETTRFFESRISHELSSDAVNTLHQQLEGWITGLHLAALTLRRDSPMAQDVITGKHRFVVDYFSQDVLRFVSEDVQHFLLQTSILDVLCASLCDAVTGNKNSQAMLEYLESENLFLVAQDEKREWFRYHPLFADFLKGELERHAAYDGQLLYRRAAEWYLAHDMAEQAFQQGLAGAAVDIVNQIFERYFAVKLLSGEFAVLRHWLESLPHDWDASYPMIGLAQAGLLLVTGQVDACMRRLDEIEQQTLAASEDIRWQVARVTAFRCFIACRQNQLAQAESLADTALQSLPQDDFVFRLDIYGALGDTYRKRGRWQEAQNSYVKALDFKQAPTFHVQAVHVYGALADLYLRQGHLRKAEYHWQQALEAIQHGGNRGLYSLPLTGWVYIRMSELLYERNELNAAGQHLAQGLERAELGGDVRSLIAGYLMMGRLKLTQGDIDAASNYLEQTRPLIENAQFVHWLSRFERFQLELWLAQDRLRAAVNWSDKVLQDGNIDDRPERVIAQLAIVRVLILKGDTASIHRSVFLLERLIPTAEADGRIGIVIEGLALRAMADWQRNQQTEALVSLERALRLAEPEGYIRLFADFGFSMARLLHEARSRDVMRDYIGELLKAFSSDIDFSAETTLAEPLTAREQDVLNLMAAGLTNREIGDELVISPQTVKKHAANIYGKLGVSNRTEAATRARELDLLD